MCNVIYNSIILNHIYKIQLYHLLTYKQSLFTTIQNKYLRQRNKGMREKH